MKRKLYFLLTVALFKIAKRQLYMHEHIIYRHRYKLGTQGLYLEGDITPFVLLQQNITI